MEIASASHTMIHPELDTVSCVSRKAQHDSISVVRNVRFSEILVTEERERPRTNPEDLDKLYFSNAEIEFFKRRFQIQNKDMHHRRPRPRRRRRLIRFADEIVTETRVIPKIPDKDISKFFFTEHELDEILEEYTTCPQNIIYLDCTFEDAARSCVE